MVPHKIIFGSSRRVRANQPLHLAVCFFSAVSTTFAPSYQPTCFSDKTKMNRKCTTYLFCLHQQKALGQLWEEGLVCVCPYKINCKVICTSIPWNQFSVSIYSGNSCILAQLHSTNKVTWLLGAVTHNHRFELQALNRSVPPSKSNHSLRLGEERWGMSLLRPSSAHQEQQLKVGTGGWSYSQESQTSWLFFSALKRLSDCSHTWVVLYILCLSRHSKQLRFPVPSLPFTLLLIPPLFHSIPYFYDIP